MMDRLDHFIPVDLIDVIIDQAEYWPHTSSTLDMTTRIYSGHLAYGSYLRETRKRGKDKSTPESRRELREYGFLLRTPPLGIQCVQNGRPAQYLSPSSIETTKPSENETHVKRSWLPPRGSRPARMVVFAILGREERLEDWPFPQLRRSQNSPMSKTSFDAGVDRIYLPTAIPPLNIEPVVWTEETATKECNDQMPAKTNPGVQNRRSAVTRPTLKAHTTVTENLSAQNKKNLVI